MSTGMAVAYAGVPVLGMSTLPFVERLPGDAEPAADSRDFLVIGRLL